MVKKNKLRYKNFNVCQLIDKGKMKLQYSDNYKEYKKTYCKTEKNKDKCSIKNIKHINKKLFAGILTFVLVTSCLSGCSNVSIDDIKYKKDEQGYVQGIKEAIDINTLKYCDIYKVRNVKEEKLYYTICLRDDFNGTYEVKYYDIFTGHELKYSDYTFRMVEALDEYITDGKVEYTEDELKEILNEYIENIDQTKKLVKE